MAAEGTESQPPPITTFIKHASCNYAATELWATLSVIHPNITRPLDWQPIETKHQYPNGQVSVDTHIDITYKKYEDLYTALKERKIELKAVVCDLLSAAAFLESANIVHADIKTGNLMYDPDTRSAVLIDFDIARYATADGLYIGISASSGYRDPLVMDGWYNDCRTELYSIGMTIVHLAAYIKGKTSIDTYCTAIIADLSMISCAAASCPSIAARRPASCIPTTLSAPDLSSIHSQSM
jgi:serine/threonine protein kinase